MIPQSIAAYFAALWLLMFVANVSNAAQDLQTSIDQAVAAGEHSVVLPAGVHRLPHALKIAGVSDFTVKGSGATLVFTNVDDGGILVTDCKGLTLEGFTVDFDPLPFTQATVDAVDPIKQEISFTVMDGYPDLNPRFLAGKAHLFSPETMSWKQEAPDIYASSTRMVTARQGVLAFSKGKTAEFEAFAIGDYVAFDFRNSRGLRIERCIDITMRGVTFWSAPSIAVVARFMDGLNTFSYTIQRGPTPSGAKVGRLMSTSADGFNYAYARRGPVIENCDFSYMGDDSVNLHGIAFFVAKAEGNTIWLLRPYLEEAFATVIQPGDAIHSLSGQSFGITGAAHIGQFAVETNPPEDFSALAARTWKRMSLKNGRLTVYRLELDGALPLTPGDFVEIPAISAPGYVIRNNHFANHRARALRLMSSHGLVENNLIEGIKQAGITIGAEFTIFREAGWVSDVTVRGNTLRNIGYDSGLRRPTAYTAGAICLFHRGETPSAQSPDSRHERIVIENNTIEDVAGPAVLINQARDVRVAGNRIEKVNQVPMPDAGSQYHLKVDGPIVVTNSFDVIISP